MHERLRSLNPGISRLCTELDGRKTKGRMNNARENAVLALAVSSAINSDGIGLCAHRLAEYPCSYFVVESKFTQKAVKSRGGL